MLRRFLAFVLILGLALPALGGPVAAAHERPAAMAAMAHSDHHPADHAPAPAPGAHKQGKHDCIGCAPGVAIGPAAAAAPAIAPLAPAPRQLAELRGRSAGPLTPPPRALT